MYKLYSASLRRHLEIRAPYLEGAGTMDDLKGTNAWKFRPSVITDEAGAVIDDNKLEVETRS